MISKIYFAILLLSVTGNCYLNPIVMGIINPEESENDPILWMVAMVGLNNSGGNANVSGSDNSENENSESPTISYSNTNLVFTLNTAIPNISPSVTGTPLTNCNTSPNLPEGLSINETTCMISGTPRANHRSTALGRVLDSPKRFHPGQKKSDFFQTDEGVRENRLPNFR